MSRWPEILLLAAAVASAAPAQAQSRYPGLGRAATPAEVRAWDIDVRPDFKGLPRGAGSVARGAAVWEAKCASCHGDFGDSNEVFPPLVGGTTREDIRTGRVKALTRPEFQRTTLMKLSSVSALWDYINRAMPWNAPKTLTTEDVYAVTAYVLNLGAVVPDDYVLSDANIAEVQAKLPNRNGMTTQHGLWDIKGKPDVRNTACMKNCEKEVKISSVLPAHARNAHGNLAEQHRLVGAVRGQTTVALAATAASGRDTNAGNAKELANRSGCLACHGQKARIVGPAFSEVAVKYRGRQGALSEVAARIRNGGAGVWGSIPMPPQPQLKDDELAAVARWILGGAD